MASAGGKVHGYALKERLFFMVDENLSASQHYNALSKSPSSVGKMRYLHSRPEHVQVFFESVHLSNQESEAFETRACKPLISTSLRVYLKSLV